MGVYALAVLAAPVASAKYVEHARCCQQWRPSTVGHCFVAFRTFPAVQRTASNCILWRATTVSTVPISGSLVALSLQFYFAAGGSRGFMIRWNRNPFLFVLFLWLSLSSVPLFVLLEKVRLQIKACRICACIRRSPSRSADVLR